MAPRTNREILTGGKKYATKQAKKHRVEEVVFDRDARVEYLTGFHKRKVERQKKAITYHKEQDRLAKIEERKKVKEERKKDMEAQMKRFNDTVRDISTFSNLGEEDDDEEVEGEEWEGIDNEEGQQKQKQKKGILQHKEIYKLEDALLLEDSPVIIDEETTVTVESLDNPAMISAQENLKAIAKANFVDLEKSDKILEDSINKAKKYAVVCGVAKPAKEQLKQKKKKFRYLTKAERRENTRKERAGSKSSKYKSDKKETSKSGKSSRSKK